MKVPDGSTHLVFFIAGTAQCVGEIRLNADVRYLNVIAQMFFKWTDAQLNRTLPASIRNIIESAKRDQKSGPSSL